MGLSLLVLGSDCEISFWMIELNLKGPSSLFEWSAHGPFQEINTVLKCLLEKDTLEITKREELPGNLFFGSTSIHTAHYTMETFPEIVERRWKRFKDTVQNDLVIFIREDRELQTTSEEIREFKQLIEQLNPTAKYKILLLSKTRNHLEIKEENVYQRDANKDFLKEQLQEIVYPLLLPTFGSDKNDKD